MEHCHKDKSKVVITVNKSPTKNKFCLGIQPELIIDSINENDNDNLWIAAAAGDIVLTNAFLCQGAQVNIEHSQMGTTPLMIAALHGHSEVCKLLCLYGSDVD